MKSKQWLMAIAGSAMVCTQLAACSKAQNASTLKVVNQETVELGDPVSLKASDYLLEKPDGLTLDDIQVKSDLMTGSQYEYNDFSKTVKSAGKDFLDVGTYKIVLQYQGQEYPVTLTVKDTVMPEFISPAAVVTIPVGTQDFDFSRIYRTSDKDKVTLKVEGNYDVNTEGTYPVTLVATDASGNVNSLEITVNVIGKNQPIKSTDQFDNELVPPAQKPVEQAPSSREDSSSQTTETTPPADSNKDTGGKDQPEQNTPSEGKSDVPSACPISNPPVGTQVYYSFSDLYAAGTAWNQQNPSNYFFYLEGADDCGNKVYFLTTGTSENAGSNPTQEALDKAKDADKKRNEMAASGKENN